MRLEELKRRFSEFTQERRDELALRSARIGDFLYDLVIQNGLLNVLEIGTCRGRNSAFLTAACEETGGHFWGMDIGPGDCDSVERVMKQLGLTNFTQICNPSLPHMSVIMSENNINLAFIDGEHSFKSTYSEYCIAKDLINKENGIILFHDVDYIHCDSKEDKGIPETVRRSGATILQVNDDKVAYLLYGTAIIPEQWIK